MPGCRTLRGLIPQNLTLNQAITDPGSHFALGTITASAPVTAVPAGVKLVAGQGITLAPGFSVALDTPFFAEVRPSLNTWNTPPPGLAGLQGPAAPGDAGVTMERVPSEAARTAPAEAMPAVRAAPEPSQSDDGPCDDPLRVARSVTRRARRV